MINSKRVSEDLRDVIDGVRMHPHIQGRGFTVVFRDNGMVTVWVNKAKHYTMQFDTIEQFIERYGNGR